MKPYTNMQASKSRTRFQIVLTGIPTLILTVFVIFKFPEFVDGMQRTMENSEVNGALDETRNTSSFGLIILLLAIFVTVILWIRLMRLVKMYKRQ